MELNEFAKLGRIYIILRNTLISLLVVVFLGVGIAAWKLSEGRTYDATQSAQLVALSGVDPPFQP